MNESPVSTPVLRLPRAGVPAPRRSVRCLPASAAGVLTALALGATAVLLPSGEPAAQDGLVTAGAALQPAAAGTALLHPVQPDATPATDLAPRARDPFAPLIEPPAAPTGGSAGTPVVTPDSGTPAGGSPGVSLPGFELPLVVDVPRQVEPPTSPVGPSAPLTGRSLQLDRVEAVGDSYEGVLAVDGAPTRVKVGDSFGPGEQLLLLSLQQGPGTDQWTAVVQAGQGEPFDLVNGVSRRIP